MKDAWGNERNSLNAENNQKKYADDEIYNTKLGRKNNGIRTNYK